MINNNELSTRLVELFNSAVAEHNLSLAEFLTLHALVHTCINASKTEGYAVTVAIIDVARSIALGRETVRRCMHKLAKKGLVERVGEYWIITNINNDKAIV